MRESHEPLAAEYLDRLAVELLARGVKCEIVTSGCAPRLQLDIPWFYSNADDQFEDHILAAPEPDGNWRYWSPWIQPIAEVGDVARAADYIYENTMYLFDNDNDDDSAGELSGPVREAADKTPVMDFARPPTQRNGPPLQGPSECRSGGRAVPGSEKGGSCDG